MGLTCSVVTGMCGLLINHGMVGALLVEYCAVCRKWAEEAVCVSKVGIAWIFCRSGKRKNREDLNHGTPVAA